MSCDRYWWGLARAGALAGAAVLATRMPRHTVRTAVTTGGQKGGRIADARVSPQKEGHSGLSRRIYVSRVCGQRLWSLVLWGGKPAIAPTALRLLPARHRRPRRRAPEPCDEFPPSHLWSLALIGGAYRGSGSKGTGSLWGCSDVSPSRTEEVVPPLYRVARRPSVIVRAAISPAVGSSMDACNAGCC